MASKSAFTKFVALTRSRGWAAFCLALCVVALSAPASAKHPTIITFDAPGAGTGAFQGTVPFCNNPPGGITGYYIDSSNVSHGFFVKGE